MPLTRNGEKVMDDTCSPRRPSEGPDWRWQRAQRLAHAESEEHALFLGQHADSHVQQAAEYVRMSAQGSGPLDAAKTKYPRGRSA